MNPESAAQKPIYKIRAAKENGCAFSCREGGFFHYACQLTVYITTKRLVAPIAIQSVRAWIIGLMPT